MGTVDLNCRLIFSILHCLGGRVNILVYYNVPILNHSYCKFCAFHKKMIIFYTRYT